MAQKSNILINTYEQGPDKEQAVHKLSNSLAGELPTRNHDTEDLLKQHYQNIHHIEDCEKDTKTTWAKQIVIPIAYAPCVTPLDQLNQISLSDLKVETHHRGSFITATTITLPYNFSSTVTIIQEVSTVTAVLVLGFQDDTISPLPQNSTVAIKEPYVQLNENSDYVIRVDHPSDIAVLRGDDPAVSMIMQFVAEKKDIKPVEWRSEGDRAFLEGKYSSAIECYTQAIDASLPLEETIFTQDAYRKRAFANLLAHRYQAAKVDSLSACSGTALDAKAYFTAGRACYSLRSYSESKSYLEKSLELEPTDIKARKELNRILIRLDEQENGNYDFAQMIREQESKIWLDHADFTANVEVGMTEKSGRGLFTTKDIAAGEILMSEKAFCLPDKYTGDGPSDTVLFNLNNNSRTPKAAQPALFRKLVQELYHNPQLCKDFFDLDGGEYVRNGKEGDIIDGVPIVDAFLVECIRLKNCFSAPRLSRNLLKRDCPEVETHLTTATWLRASYTNHSCVPNCGRAFIGDMMIVRALHALPKGTEITHQYIAPDASTLFRRKGFPTNWGFECACRLCSGERESPDTIHTKRTDLAKKIKKEALKMAPTSKIPIANIRTVERMMRKLEDLHERSVYANLPRLTLVHPSIWLMEVYRFSKNYTKMVRYAIEVLKNFGFGDNIVDIDNNNFSMKWEGGIVNTEAFNSLVIAAEGYDMLGKSVLAEGCRAAAKRMFLVLAGSEVGIERFLPA
ncbi:hypothetical protein BJ875DRAFT_526591 [Amylocarpus encephaloides]|uniref:SET domain-containing protein n=1 Tax=Amylocarpus encephaloides TaxID=45428 RepID=A0A9P7Y8P2_9HELO|nr:hypothetical protein BJ875DRAFT_526591 [Amylocarpus encephaloides]